MLFDAGQCSRVGARAGVEPLLNPCDDFRPTIADRRLRRGAEFHEGRPLPLVPPDFERIGLDAEQCGSLLIVEQIVEIDRCGHSRNSRQNRPSSTQTVAG